MNRITLTTENWTSIFTHYRHKSPAEKRGTAFA
ncbi:hypothetical protein MNBD_GAMMA05-529 [hydrothermal vent metagenome]|uniref:Uncharacterized protein n=1 Tax=hydrothermal vent metagenome TaxID=652676 RepID=A0A3B0X7J7_9ZZZZ